MPKMFKLLRPGEARDGLTRLERILLAAFILVLCLWLIPPAAARIRRNSEARVVLTDAKAARMAVETVAIERAAAGLPFADQSGPYGMAGGLAEQVRALAALPGEIWILQTDTDGYEALRLLYRENGYTADYDAVRGGWEVTRDERIISGPGK